MNKDIVKDVAELKAYNEELLNRLNSTTDSLHQIKARERLYQSTLQNLKNDLKKFCERIDVTPHSSCPEYQEMFYNNKYKKVVEEIDDYCNQQNLKYDLTACEILSIIEKVKDNNNGI